TRRIRKDGRVIDVSISVSPLRDSDGHIIGAASIKRDVTERKQLERELRRHVEQLGQADQRKNEFLAMLAHELRNPLAPIRNAVDRAVETVSDVIAEQQQNLTVSLPPEPIWLEADPVRLSQVVSNLLNNAAKYTDRGGRISLSGERAGTDALIRIRDNGMGIP